MTTDAPPAAIVHPSEWGIEGLEAAAALMFGERFARRLVEKICVTEKCWHWIACLAGATKRPCIHLEGHSVYVARVVLRLKLGRPIRRGKLAAHECDNGICVRPLHLHEATHSKNLREAWRRGRRPLTFVNE